MQKLITFCDYCGKEIETVYTLLPVRLSESESTYKMKPDYEPFDMCLDCIRANLIMIKPGPVKRKEAAAVADQEENEAPEVVPGEPEEQQDEEPATPEAEPEQQAGAAEKETGKRKKVDHGRIVALYTANPPRSIEWIADDCRCSQQTVINHLKKAGLYKTLQEQKEETQEEEE